MTLAALISAYHDSSDPGDGLRATLPLAGRTVIERQARLAADAGARPIILVVERQPPELAAALQRLRGEGLDILVARSAAEAAKAVQAGDRILLMGDGLVADDSHVVRLLDGEGITLMTVPDVRFDDRFERIDAESRWAGLALIDGQMLKHTAAMLQDWDLQSTLLRRAVQANARQLRLGGDPSDPQLIVAERSADLAELQARILENSSLHQGDWTSRYLLAPIEQAAMRRLMATAVSPDQLWLANLALAAVSAVAFSRGWLWSGLLLFLTATLLDGIAERLARLRFSGLSPDSWIRRLMPAVSAAALLALGYSRSAVNGWVSLVLAIGAIAFILALEGERKGQEIPGRLFLAEPKGMAWLMLPFAGAGQWTAGLYALAAYAAASFFWAQRYVHRRATG